MNLSEQTRKVLKTLTPRKEKVLRMRFGTGEKSDHTLEEVGLNGFCSRIRAALYGFCFTDLPAPTAPLQSGLLPACGQLARGRRQVPLLDRYIADFYAPSARLVVEVDGKYHDSPARARADARRTQRLEAAGLRVVRVSNAVVLSDMPSALGLIAVALLG